MAKWKTAGIVVVMVGLVAFGAFAAQQSIATMTQTQTQASAECSEECEPERTRTMKEEGIQELRQDNHQRQQKRLEGNGPHGNGGGRQMRRAGTAN